MEVVIEFFTKSSLQIACHLCGYASLLAAMSDRQIANLKLQHVHGRYGDRYHLHAYCFHFCLRRYIDGRYIDGRHRD